MASERQRWDVEGYAKHARFVSDLGEPLLPLLSPKPGERILDLGCGDGTLTTKIAATGASIIGVDKSAEFVAAACRLGIEARQVDAHRLVFDREFDAVFSNAVLHWMTDIDAVLSGVACALRPGGRFVGEFGGHGNVAAIVVALLSALARRGIDGTRLHPWYFPTTKEYRERLEAHGFTAEYVELIPRPTPLPTDMEGWLETFAAPFLNAVEDRAAAKADVLNLLRPALCDSDGQWTADYVRLRFAARL